MFLSLFIGSFIHLIPGDLEATELLAAVRPATAPQKQQPQPSIPTTPPSEEEREYSCEEILDDCFHPDLPKTSQTCEVMAACLESRGCSATCYDSPRTLDIPRVQPKSSCPTRQWIKCEWWMFWCSWYESKDSGNEWGPRYPVCHEGGTPTSGATALEQPAPPQNGW